jgi:phage shock protein A
MAEPDNIILEHLRAVRAKLDDIDRRIENLDRKVDSKAEAAQVAELDAKLTGLAHMVMSSLGSVVHSLDSLDRRVARLEREHV